MKVWVVLAKDGDEEPFWTYVAAVFDSHQKALDYTNRAWGTLIEEMEVQ